MKSANNKLTIIADVLLLLLFAAVLGFIIWRLTLLNKSNFC